MGYGKLREPKTRTVWLAHRFAYTKLIGPIPEGLSVCHSCDNPPCVNPDHLFVATHAGNMDDKFAKGRDNVSGHNHWSRRHPERIKRGAEHHSSKLSEDQVRRIKALLAEGHTQRTIADLMSITQTLVSLIKRGKSWSHVE